VYSKIAGSDRCPKIIECIAAYKDSVKENTGGQESVGIERVPENLQVYQIISYYYFLIDFIIIIYQLNFGLKSGCSGGVLAPIYLSCIYLHVPGSCR
jgi:hypothetical protein